MKTTALKARLPSPNDRDVSIALYPLQLFSFLFFFATFFIHFIQSLLFAPPFNGRVHYEPEQHEKRAFYFCVAMSSGVRK